MSKVITVSYEVKVFEKVRRNYRRVLFRHRQPVRSFLYNWTKALYGLSYSTAAARVVTLVNRSGIRFYYPDLYAEGYPIFEFRAREAWDEYGILFGKGTTSPTLDDYDLESPIPHGTDSGRLYYNQTHTTHETDSDRSRLIVWRTADNESGGDITVSEIGLAFRVYTGDYHYVLILRDVLDTAIVVAYGQSVEGRYVMEFVL